MSNVIIKEGYKSKLDLIETEIAIKFVKDTFEKELAKALNLTRVSAPLFVLPETGLNDDLNGYERPVGFDIHDLKKNAQIVQSLAKWKRNALRRYGFNVGSGLYTDMNAIRRDEELDNFHSVYVDQWDWERIITRENRNMTFLKQIVKKIYKAICATQTKVMKKYPVLTNKLPKEIKFIKSTDLYKQYPDKTPKERETLACKEYGAIFVSQIGWPIDGKQPHDGRAADYDDWKLNGDILVYFEVLDCALELSSMGVRVDKDSLTSQTGFKKEYGKLSSPYSQDILNDRLPLTIGGGIGQSRLCMFMLNKMHVGEVQASLWTDEDMQILSENKIEIL
ncbi:MAG: aspartate--ammonia ligase [Acholeplasmatales bacterium]|nr:aspartate--ammonia ligase [Acholeplasmatales bacterium]